MAKTSALDRAIAQLDQKIAALQLARAELVAQVPVKLRTVRVKLPKPGELRDRAILGGEPSL